MVAGPGNSKLWLLQSSSPRWPVLSGTGNLCRFDKFSMDITQALGQAQGGTHEILVQVSDPSGKK